MKLKITSEFIIDRSSIPNLLGDILASSITHSKMTKTKEVNSDAAA